MGKVNKFWMSAPSKNFESSATWTRWSGICETAHSKIGRRVWWVAGWRAALDMLNRLSKVSLRFLNEFEGFP